MESELEGVGMSPIVFKMNGEWVSISDYLHQPSPNHLLIHQLPPSLHSHYEHSGFYRSSNRGTECVITNQIRGGLGGPLFNYYYLAPHHTSQ